MGEFRLTKDARRDLREIGRYTEKEWGLSQRDRYLRMLSERLSYLARHPQSSPARPELFEGCRSAVAGRHLIFYEESGSAITIVRVLHASMDWAHRVDRA